MMTMKWTTRCLLGVHLFVAAVGASSTYAGTLGPTGDLTNAPVESALSVAIEYYHPGLDHYFLTADPLEIEALSSGRFQGWVRTGEKFAVLPSGSSVAGSTPVCRFFSQLTGSHFYSGIPSECQDVRTRFADSWTLESDDVYRAFLPDSAGDCPAGTEAVYRLWNNRADSNHRYTTDPTVVQTMKARGYIAEGFGRALSIPVALCAPVGVACALAATNPAPIVGTPITISATCTGATTNYVWSGCDSTSDMCTTTSANEGIKTYGLVANGPYGTSDAVAVAIDWKSAAAGIGNAGSQAPSCTLSASNTAPAAGTAISLSVLCTVLPTSYTWTGCSSTGSTCTATSPNGGAITYRVTAMTPAGAATPTSITVNWQGSSTATTSSPSSSSSSSSATSSTSSSTSAAPPSRTPIASIPQGEARVISSNTMADAWQGPQPAGGGTIYKAVAAWNSAIFAPTLGANGSIVFAGGGDADSWDTAAFAFDIATGVWTRIKDRTTALSWDPATDKALPPGDPKHWDRTYGEHGDGTPGAPHTYDLVTYLPPEAVGGKGALLYPVSRFMYTIDSTDWSHKLTLDRPAWSRASTSAVPANMNLLGMSDYDPTSKRVWLLAATATGAYNDALQYLDFSNGSGVGTPGSVSLGKEYLIYSGTMRFWRGTDGTKRYLVWLSYDPRARLNLIDLDAPQTGVHPLDVASPPANFGYPNSGFTLGKNIGFAMHPMPDQDNSQIYEIRPPSDAIDGTWTITTKRLAGITLPTEVNNGLWKRLEWHESLGIATFFLSARGPVYAYRPGDGTTTSTTDPTSSSTSTPAPTPTPAPTTTTTQPAVVGSLKLSAQSVPYSGPGGTLGMSKHLNFARVGNRWYKCAGDHRSTGGQTPDAQDGRQEIFSLNVPSNDWTLEQPYFIRTGMNSGDVQIALPDDAFCVARNNEIWSFVSERVDQMNTTDQTTWARSNYGSDIVTQNMSHIGAWNVATKTWRVILPRPAEMIGDRAFRGLYDAQTDRFIIPTYSSFLQISGQGVDVSPRFGASNVLQDYGNYDFHSSGIVQDGRTAYVYDKKFGALYSFQIPDSPSQPFALVKVLDLPELTYSGAGPGILMAWHPGLRAIVLAGIGQRQFYAFQVDSRALTKWNRPDGFVNGAGNYVAPSDMFYDPDTSDIVSVGGIDWDTGVISPVYWRMHITQ